MISCMRKAFSLWQTWKAYGIVHGWVCIIWDLIVHCSHIWVGITTSTTQLVCLVLLFCHRLIKQTASSSNSYLPLSYCFDLLLTKRFSMIQFCFDILFVLHVHLSSSRESCHANNTCIMNSFQFIINFYAVIITK